MINLDRTRLTGSLTLDMKTPRNSEVFSFDLLGLFGGFYDRFEGFRLVYSQFG